MIGIHIGDSHERKGGPIETPGNSGSITKRVPGVLVKDSMTAILINSCS